MRRPGRASRACSRTRTGSASPCPATARRSAPAGRTRTCTSCSSRPTTELHVKPSPVTGADTDKLWEWDVSEAFIGTDPDIKKYKEFQVSPQGEWVDLAIDRGTKPATHDTTWNSGYEVKAKLDRNARVWYGAMRIPLDSLGIRAPKNGTEARLNLYRCQGPPPDRKYINWQPVNNESFHTPEAFGRLRLDN